MNSYEIHLTFDSSSEEEVRAHCETTGYKFSKIMGDPVLGDKIFCYATTHTTDPVEALERMHLMCDSMASIGVLRSKIELILYDSR